MEVSIGTCADCANSEKRTIPSAMYWESSKEVREKVKLSCTAQNVDAYADDDQGVGAVVWVEPAHFCSLWKARRRKR